MAKARLLVVAVYKLADDGRLSKDFGLKNQLCRAAVSTMSNIAEGFGRNTNRDFAHFLDVSRASALEVQSLLYVALDVGYIAEDDFNRLYQMTEETIAKVAKLSSYLRGEKQ